LGLGLSDFLTLVQGTFEKEYERSIADLVERSFADCNMKDRLPTWLRECFADCVISLLMRFFREENLSVQINQLSQLQVVLCIRSDWHHFAGSGSASRACRSGSEAIPFKYKDKPSFPEKILNYE
jgi:hypothetical protein